MTEKKVGSVTYREVDASYFKQRGLKRYARVWSLWALGVGAVISGDFFGWNFGLAAGGFGGLLLATIIITVMYAGLCFSIAEMAPAMPHTGGAYSFGRSAMGPWGGFITGLAENMEYILTPAVIVVGIGGYLGAIFETPDGMVWVWWLAAYATFVGLNFWSVALSFRFSVFITLLALAILLVFYIGAIPHFDPANLFTVGDGSFLPFGWQGVGWALPFAIWFYLAIEELPLASEESHDPKRDMPKAITLGLFTLIVTAFLVLFLNTGIAPGAARVGRSTEPLFLGLKTIFGAGIGTKILALIAVAGLIASFHTIIFAYGRNIYSLSRAGYFPKFFSRTHGKHKTPHIALLTGAAIGFGVALILKYTADSVFGAMVGASLLYMAVFGALIAYIMQCVSFILLRRNMPDIERPYRSPLGSPGAAIALIICVVTLVFLLTNPIYQPGVIGTAVWFGLGLLYFALVGRNRLVLSPEEEFAITAGVHGHPESEGYGTTRVEDTGE